jgi:hypothetical protein
MIISSFSILDQHPGKVINELESLIQSIHFKYSDISDLLQNIFSSNPLIKEYEKVIEVGVLDLDNFKVKLLMSLK